MGYEDEQGDKAHSREATLRVKAVLKNVPVAIDYVTECARAAGFGDQALYQIQLAVDEACANVVQHAYEGMEPGSMEVSCCSDEQGLVIRVREWGRGFDPNGVAEPDVNAPLEERAFGGLGLFLLKQVMDGVTFRFDPDEGNELTMVKRLEIGG
jgi:serine/threonine-protein kinase RsbW